MNLGPPPLTAEALAGQVQAHEALWRDAIDVWEHIKYELWVTDPARNPAYTGVAGQSPLNAFAMPFGDWFWSLKATNRAAGSTVGEIFLSASANDAARRIGA